MRAVDKGTHPTDMAGHSVAFTHYEDAALYLKERLGRFCSYCERKIPTGLAVEHVMPKSLAPHLEKAWENLLLACANCNSSKGSQWTERGDCLWPDTDDTFAAFVYEPSGAIKPLPALDSDGRQKASTLLELVGLDKSPDNAPAADYRHKDRLEQWRKAEAALAMLGMMMGKTPAKPNELEDFQSRLIEQVTDGYSIWATVFRSDLTIVAALAKKFPGTLREQRRG